MLQIDLGGNSSLNCLITLVLKTIVSLIGSGSAGGGDLLAALVHVNAFYINLTIALLEMNGSLNEA
jgi:hypothetical protein